VRRLTLRYSVLASGSTGNALYVENDEYHLLIDAGLSGKQLEKLMDQVGVDPKALDALLITHEHSDHIKGVGVMARRYDLPVYANEATWNAMAPLIGEMDEEKKHVVNTGEAIDFGTLKVESYGISHDAAEPIGFCFYEDDVQLSLTTDLGYVSDRIKQKICSSQAIIMESNHDVELLRMGAYPWSIKRRILSDVGHLSNEAAAEALCDILSGATEKVHLAHLSQDNNVLELARLTVNNILEDHGIFLDQEVEIHDTYFNRPTPLEQVKRK
jgi:phosphoribosyl 1,2-cyclic phosphodiesterase